MASSRHPLEVVRPVRAATGHQFKKQARAAGAAEPFRAAAARHIGAAFRLRVQLDEFPGGAAAGTVAKRIDHFCSWSLGLGWLGGSARCLDADTDLTAFRGSITACHLGVSPLKPLDAARVPRL
jgi:hypothetical protein